MNFVENNGKKVAAIMCVASSFPVVAAVYAMETQPGWHGDRYVNEDATVAKGWQEIEGKSYYFSEKDGTVDKEVTKSGVVASVSSSVTVDVQKSVKEQTKTIVQEEVKKNESTETITETPVQPSAPVENPSVDPTPIVPTPEPELPGNDGGFVTDDVEDEVSDDTTTPDVPAEGDKPSTDEPGAGDVELPSTPSDDNNADSGETTPPEIETPGDSGEEITPPDVDSGDNGDSGEEVTPPPVEEKPEVPEVPEQPPVLPSNPYEALNNRIAAEAKKLVGVTDGLWCTQVVQRALANAGVSDAMQLWPDEYFRYGYETNDPQPGNLIYYYNGGRGVDHIAIYIGNGQAVHGNFRMADGSIRTIIASVNYGGGGRPQYIQVQR